MVRRRLAADGFSSRDLSSLSARARFPLTYINPGACANVTRRLQPMAIVPRRKQARRPSVPARGRAQRARAQCARTERRYVAMAAHGSLFSWPADSHHGGRHAAKIQRTRRTCRWMRVRADRLGRTARRPGSSRRACLMNMLDQRREFRAVIDEQLECKAQDASHLVPA